MPDPHLRAAPGLRPAPPPGPWLVAGIGRAGTAAAGALASLPGAAPVRAWDAAAGPSQQRAARALRDQGVAVVLGGSGIGLLDEHPAPRALVKSPGIPSATPLIAAAAARGITVLDEIELGWRLDTRPLVAVTGTNGKSTVASLALCVLRAAGLRPALAGNTRDAPPFSALERTDADVVVCEVSSFQLEWCPALLPEVGVLTNLSDDHLAHHGGREAYAACKRRMFIRGDRVVPLAVIGVDQPFGRALAAGMAELGGRVLTTGAAGEYALTSATVRWTGTTLECTTPSGPLAVDLPHHGVHMAENAMAAIALADGLGVPRAAALDAIASAAPVAGRFERVDDGRSVAVVIDYAHNEDGVRRTIEAARALTHGAGRVIAVGCAPWAYPPDQRRRMGERTGSADVVIATSDRWHAHDPEDPPPEFPAGAAAVLGRAPRVISDRRDAIEAAIGEARPGDLVLVLGRGPRIGGPGLPAGFDDRSAARAALAAA